MSQKSITRRLVRDLATFYQVQGRAHLPWRRTHEPYKVLVSEMMLQQTQVDRAIPFYKAFVKKYPTARTLARASLRDVLKVWQGLGYNRRAKYLHEAAKAVVRQRAFPKTVAGIEALPGVGPYTARAVAAFAYNSPEVFVETNIRTVFIHYFFRSSALQHTSVSDKELLPLITQALAASAMQPRDFYGALMDYGSNLKKQGIRVNPRSTQYVKQKKFEGSARQLRGAILRELLKHRATAAVLGTRIPRTQDELKVELARLTAEGLVALRGKYFSIAK